MNRTDTSTCLALHPFAARLIRMKAAQLCRRTDFSRSDFQDLEQSMRMHLLEQGHHFDPQRGTVEAFITKAVQTAVCMQLRHRSRFKRKGKNQVYSLEQTMVECEGEEMPLGETLLESDGARRHGLDHCSDLERIDRDDAVQQALAALSPAQRELIAHAAEHGVSSAARKFGLSRRQVENTLRNLRGHFQNFGLN
jgi:RNA polymerase sigma factor (sigma-70 family)